MLERYHPLLLGMPLFAGVAAADLPALLACVGGREARFAKGAFVFLAGDTPGEVGILLDGRLHILKEDAYGYRSILAEVEPGEAFGEAYACAGSVPLGVSVQAEQDSAVLFLDFDRVMVSCEASCPFHHTLVRNMVRIIAQNSLRLMDKLEVVTKRTLRERLLAYLAQLANTQGGGRVVSPLGRIDLADYLGVDRSALTREMNKMRGEGLIDFEKNNYTLLFRGDH